jgi:hypothetical protein
MQAMKGFRTSDTFQKSGGQIKSLEAIPFPRIKPIGNGEWVLQEPYSYTTLGGCKIVVPSGFITDGASSPFHVLITQWGGHYGAAALIHDYLYSLFGKGYYHPCAPTRRHADDIFLEIMRRAGVRPLVRLGMFVAVRALGANRWIKNLVIR